jgi:putative PIN family toxin of toxin-antitoxin system
MYIDEGLLRQAKVAAARGGKHDYEVVEAALERYLGLKVPDRVWARSRAEPGVLISAAIAPDGAPAAIIRAAREGRFDLVLSPKLLAELAGVLRRDAFRRYLTLEEAAEYVEGLAVIGETMSDVRDPTRISRDPNDDYLIALAEAASASILVSGDADLLSLDLPSPSVRSRREFLDALA